MSHIMKLKILAIYPPERFTLSVLKEAGICAVRGLRTVTPEFLKIADAANMQKQSRS